MTGNKWQARHDAFMCAAISGALARRHCEVEPLIEYAQAVADAAMKLCPNEQDDDVASFDSNA